MPPQADIGAAIQPVTVCELDQARSTEPPIPGPMVRSNGWTARPRTRR